MKKLIAVALATLFVVGIVANVAMADDRVQLSGEMRVRAWNVSAADDDDQNWFDQRLRVGTTINVADGVKVISRMDFAEDMWGSDNWSTVRYNDNISNTSELNIDRAYLQVDKGIIGVAAGQQLITLGNAIAYDNQATGIKLDIKTPVVITLGYTKESERGRATDEENGYSEDVYDRTGLNYDTVLDQIAWDPSHEAGDSTEDIDTWLLNIGYASDMFSVNGFYATGSDGMDDGWEPNVVGINGTFTAGIVSVNAELDVFGGDIYGVDVMGTQFWGNVEAAVLDNLKVGVDLVWSDGNDFEDDEIKITALNDWTDWSIMDRGPFVNDIIPGSISDAMDPVPYGGDLEGLGSAEFGAQEGSIGGGVYAVFTPMEGLNFYAQFMYLAPENDDTIDVWSDAQVYSLAAEWFFAPNTSIAAQYHKTEWSSDYEELDDSSDVIVARLAVTF